jgi:hypothetical protein
MRANNLAKADVLRAVERKVYNRGLDYLRDGRVRLRDVMDNAGRAVVRGTENYVAEFVFEGELSGRCTCPASQGKAVCKHVVATALAYIDDSSPKDQTDIVKALLDDMPRAELIATILDQTIRDENHFEDLVVAAIERAVKTDPARLSLERVVSSVVILLRRGIDGDSRSDDLIVRVVAIIAGCLDQGRPDVASGAAARAIQLVDKAYVRNDRFYEDASTEADRDEDPAGQLITLHATALARLGASKGYISDQIIEICERRDFSKRIDAYERILSGDTARTVVTC